VEAELIAAARRSHAREDDYAPDRARQEGYLHDRPHPASLDLRAGWHDVADQGRTTSCVGWAVADSVLRWQLVKSDRLAPDERLSARYVWMASKEFDQRITYPSTFLEEDGTSLKAGLDVVRKFGAALESELPWDRGLVHGTPEAFNKAARRRRIMAYYNLGDDSSPDITAHYGEWRRWLHESGPVLVLIKLDPYIHTNDGVLEDLDETAVTGSHAAALYGYGPGYFLLRSSWGTDWGDAGYARMTHAYAAEAVIESYGVMV